MPPAAKKQNQQDNADKKRNEQQCIIDAGITISLESMRLHCDHRSHQNSQNQPNRIQNRSDGEPGFLVKRLLCNENLLHPSDSSMLHTRVPRTAIPPTVNAPLIWLNNDSILQILSCNNNLREINTTGTVLFVLQTKRGRFMWFENQTPLR